MMTLIFFISFFHAENTENTSPPVAVSYRRGFRLWDIHSLGAVSWDQAAMTKESDRAIISEVLLQQYGSVDAFDERLSQVLFDSLANSDRSHLYMCYAIFHFYILIYLIIATRFGVDSGGLVGEDWAGSDCCTCCTQLTHAYPLRRLKARLVYGDPTLACVDPPNHYHMKCDFLDVFNKVCFLKEFNPFQLVPAVLLVGALRALLIIVVLVFWIWYAVFGYQLMNRRGLCTVCAGGRVGTDVAPWRGCTR